MSRLDTTLRELQAGIQIPTDDTHTLVIDLKRVRIYEAQDANFHFNSAVFMPMGMELAEGKDRLTVSALETIAQALLYAESSGVPLCIAGHTDTVGPASENLTLSRKRADNVLAFVKGDREAWAASAAKHVVRDVQHILTWAAYAHGYGCDPLGIDGQAGPRTFAALQTFREVHNVVRGAKLTVDQHWVDEDDWGAFFELYEATLATLLERDADGLSALRSAVTWHGTERVACGESWPLVGRGQDGFRSAVNRRVDLVFLENGDFAELEGERLHGQAIYGAATRREWVPIDPLTRPLRLKVLGGDRQPLADRDYRLVVAGQVFEDTTDGDGLLAQDVPATALFGDLSVVLDPDRDLRQSWQLLFGPMPARELDLGVQARLGHLGVYSGSPREGDIASDPKAVAAYQRTREDLTETGAIDDDTRTKLDDEVQGLLA